MALNKDFLTGVFEGIEKPEERIEKVLKEYEADITGLKVNRDAVLSESKGYKEKLEKLAAEYGTEKSGFQKRIEELESRIKSSGSEETKAFYEAEKKQIQDMYAAKLAEADKAIGQHKAAHDELYSEYLKVLKNTELDRAMDGLQNLDPGLKNALRDVFWSRNQFDFQNVEGEKKLLNKDFHTIANTLADFISTDEGKRFILSNSTGGGATGSTSIKPPVKNPFVKGQENLDEQARLFRENKGLYESLKAQAAASG
jgi:chromosome segregation ATPase